MSGMKMTDRERNAMQQSVSHLVDAEASIRAAAACLEPVVDARLAHSSLKIVALLVVEWRESLAWRCNHA